MFKHSLRTLVRYRLYSIINLLGLALSLTCVVIIARYVHSELTVDSFNTKLDRIYITTEESSNSPGAPGFAGFPEERNLFNHSGVEKYSSFNFTGDDILVGNTSYSARLLMIDSSFLQIFDYTVVMGATNLRRPEDAFLTEAFAAKLFGTEDPLGKTLSYPGVNKILTVAGIVRMPETKSLLSFDMLTGKQLEAGSLVSHSVFLLSPEVDYREINRQYSEFIFKTPSGHSLRYQLFPYRDVYFAKNISGYGLSSRGNRTYIFILTATGVLLLLTGLANYINIYSVMMIRRNREFGMKKVFGAGGGVIFVQLTVENMLLTAGALVLAFWLTSALSPFVENTFGIRQYPVFGFDVCLALVLAVALPVAVSIAPYLRYRYFSPVRSLSSVGNIKHRFLFSRNFFLCFQYFITTGLIIVSAFFTKQLYFMLDKDLGFRTENIISVPFLKLSNASSFVLSDEEYESEIKKIKETGDKLRQKLNASPLLERWSFGQFPFDMGNGFEFKTPAGNEFQTASLIWADETWFKTFDIQLLEGRLWDNETDTRESYNLIVNESTLKHFGIPDYREGLLQPHRRIWWSANRSDEMKTNPPYRIVGVVKDFHTEHLSKQVKPVVFHFLKGHETLPVTAAFAPGHRQDVIRFMKTLYDEFVGGEFSYSFIEDRIAGIYREDKKIVMIYTVFTGVAIVISMLGLFGLSLFDIRQRRKEIAIRKINGAQITDILRLLMKKYFILLGFAFAVATPAALFVISKYLENFAYKTPVSWWLFAAALTVTAAISLVTLIWQTYKAGNENPANVIKS
ncbi:MAG: ABC transporter permease [Prevotellaceae bacterium]|jgi:ABC-type antimicrobial peptide transport system permease subunit|nr:ABC transporter permease [Prevotellaceae bacterium]